MVQLYPKVITPQQSNLEAHTRFGQYFDDPIAVYALRSAELIHYAPCIARVQGLRVSQSVVKMPYLICSRVL